MAGSAELMAGDLEFAWLGKGKGRLVDLPGDSLEAVVRTQEAQHVDSIGAGNAKRDSNVGGDHDTLGHKDKLLRNHAHGNGSGWAFSRPEIALDEFPMQVQGRGVKAFAPSQEMP